MADKANPLTVNKVYNVASGRYIDADFYLKMNDYGVNRLRRWLNDFYHQNKRYLVCALCHGPLYLRGSKEIDSQQQLHFAHYQSDEYSTCPLNENNSSITPKQVKAKQYRGAQESKRHERLKNAIGEIMKMDTDCRGTIIDKCYADREKHERRQPDVQTRYKDISLVFEIQLSTEFITIISEREAYYKEKKAFMLWIFDSFAQNRLMNQSEKDIFYANNANAFCIDQYLIDKSKNDKKLSLLVVYLTPYVESGKIKNKLHEPKEITIDNITFDEETFSAYYFPYDKTYQELKLSIIHENLKKLVSNSSCVNQLDAYLHRISDIAPDFKFSLYNFIVYMLSAKEGKDVLGREQSKYISNCQLFLHSHGRASWFFYFYSILKHNGHDFLSGKGKKTMKDKAESNLKNFKANPTHEIYSCFYPEKCCEELFAFLFPREYEKFIKLIEWTGIEWEKLDTTSFLKLDRYELDY